MPNLTPELKNYYSRKLLDRLVPALQHANSIVADPVPADVPSEMESAVRGWQNYFGLDNDYREPSDAEKWDDGYYTMVYSS